ncbi:MAG TPA: HAD family hydrolase [Thermomicrobiales bacterium]
MRTASLRGLRPITPPPTLVLFDLDDTLCDYASARALRLRIAFGQALAHRDNAAPDVDLDALIAESIAMQPHGSDHFTDLLARYGVTDKAIIEQARAWYQTNRFHGLQLFSDACESLALIRAALPGRRLGIITNGPAEVQREKVALLGLESAVDFILISGELGIAKPDPAIFAEALRRGAATADEAVFIGDSPEFDIAGARAAGIRAVWLNRAGRTWPAGLPHPDYVAPSLMEVRRLLGTSEA